MHAAESSQLDMSRDLSADMFRERFYTGVTRLMWDDWRWQMRNRITTYEGLKRILNLTGYELPEGLPFSITPYYASLLEYDNPQQPLRKAAIPTISELEHNEGEMADPLNEDSNRPVPGIIHRYGDRVVFLVTDFCSTRCRYCTRSRFVSEDSENLFNELSWQQSINYIKGNRNIRDVLLSGGDPLTLPDEKLDWLLSQLSSIPHVEFLRIGTKVPVVLPQRITPGLLELLKKYHPLWMSIHFIHPEELRQEVKQACCALADAGIPLGSQTVLLKGINDDTATLKKLFLGLLKIRVKPYYLYQCDPILGSGHFRTPVEKGIEIVKGLRGHTTGYAVPTYVIDAPGGGGKIPLMPDYVVDRDSEGILLRSYNGRLYRYPEKGAEFR